MSKCEQCGADVAGAEQLCDSCGAVSRVAVPRPDAPEGHDEAQLGGIVLLTDKGIVHEGNEDAAAAGTVAGDPYAIAAAVCDGVSTSAAAHIASRAASVAGVDAMLRSLASSRDPRSAVVAGLEDATKAAAEARSPQPGGKPPSCTYSSVSVVMGADGEAQIAIGNVGDSRVYWIPEPPGEPTRLSVDDSLAQGLIERGVPADADIVLRGAHTLTRWLGGEADEVPWDESSIGAMTTTDRGVLLLCSDGLHNYLPEAADVAQFLTGDDLQAAAAAMVEHALQSGGHDNITVVLVPIGR